MVDTGQHAPSGASIQSLSGMASNLLKSSSALARLVPATWVHSGPKASVWAPPEPEATRGDSYSRVLGTIKLEGCMFKRSSPAKGNPAAKYRWIFFALKSATPGPGRRFERKNQTEPQPLEGLWTVQSMWGVAQKLIIDAEDLGRNLVASVVPAHWA